MLYPTIGMQINEVYQFILMILKLIPHTKTVKILNYVLDFVAGDSSKKDANDKSKNRNPVDYEYSKYASFIGELEASSSK